MIVVSDTTPLNYLVPIGEALVLSNLFDAVYVPSIVLGEMSHPRAPDLVKRWAGSPPDWLTVMDPSLRYQSTVRLDQGEADTISLALEMRISTLLIDERRGSQVALSQGLLPLPTLALLEKAAEIGIVDLPLAVRKLRTTNIRLPQNIVDSPLERDHRRRANQP